MEQYNLLLVYESPELMGLNIMKTDAYKKLIERDPGLIHDNLGDFFSDVSCSGLADTIHKILASGPDRKSMDWLQVVDAQSFDITEVNKSATKAIGDYHEEEAVDSPDVPTYLVKEDNGIRFYNPLIYVGEGQLPNQRVEYFAFATKFVEELFSDKKAGSLQTFIKRARERTD